MSGPWEKYQQPAGESAAPAAADGPWKKYAQSQGAGIVANAGAGVSRGIYGDVLGAPVDGANWLLKQVGLGSERPLGGSEDMRSVSDYIATIPDRVINAVGERSIDPLIEGKSQRVEPVTEGERIAYSGGRAAGNAIGTMGAGAALAGARGAGQVAQGVGRVLTTQPASQVVSAATGGAVGEATDNPWLGLAAAMAVPVAMSGAQRGVSALFDGRGSMTPQQRNLVATARHENIPLPIGDEINSPTLRWAQSLARKMPTSAGMADRADDATRTAFNRAAWQRAGFNFDRAAPEQMDDAFRTLGGQFNALAARTRVNADQQLFADINRVAHEYGRRLPTDVAPVFQSYVDDLMQLRNAAAQPGVANVTIDGRPFQNILSGLSRAARGAGNNPALQSSLRELREAMMDALERSGTRQTAEEWRTLRRLWANLEVIDGAVKGGTQTDRMRGNIPFGSLTQSVRKNAPGRFSRGAGDLNELARIGDMLADKLPSSGTSERNLGQMLLGGAGAGGAASMAGASPMGTAGAVGAVLAGPPVIQALLNSPAVRDYLTRNPAASNAALNDLARAVLAGQGVKALSGPN